MSFEVTVTPTVYDVAVSVNPSVQPFDVEVTVGSVPTFNLTTNGDSGASTFDPLTGELNIPEYTLDGLGGVPESRTLTINGTTQDLSANRTFTIPTHDAVTIGSPANGLAIDVNQILTIGLASGSQAGALSSIDWSTFNNKQNSIGYTPENVANKAINFTSPDDTKYPTTLAVSTALAGKQDVLTNPITGTGVAGQVSFWTGTGTQSGDSGLVWDNSTKNLRINQLTDAGYRLDINGTARVQGELTVNGVNIGLGGGGITSNTIVGLNAGLNNTTGVNNSFFGRDAGRNNTTGVNNSFFGRDAGRNNTTGAYNSFFGVNAGLNNTTGVNNSFFGLYAGQNNTTGTNNSFFGRAAGQNNTTGAYNSFFGLNAGRFLANGSTSLTIANNSVFLGFDTRANADGETNQIVIGYQAIGLGSNTTVIGNSSTTFGRWWGSLLVGTSTNEASSILTLESTTRGFLPPRMTGAQAEAISSPAEGLLVYSTDGTGTTITSKGWWGFNGSTWAQLN